MQSKFEISLDASDAHKEVEALAKKARQESETANWGRKTSIPR